MIKEEVMDRKKLVRTSIYAFAALGAVLAVAYVAVLLWAGPQPPVP
jgi:hypothetical protein